MLSVASATVGSLTVYSFGRSARGLAQQSAFRIWAGTPTVRASTVPEPACGVRSVS